LAVGAILPPLFFGRAASSRPRPGPAVQPPGTHRRRFRFDSGTLVDDSFAPIAARSPIQAPLKDLRQMANTTSAKKATRKIARRTVVNKSRRTQMRGTVRSVEEAIQSGDREAALKALARAEPALMQAAQRNIIHRNNASRKVSRLSKQISKLGQAQA
jgi:small subunit ribosomal protein S20